MFTNDAGVLVWTDWDDMSPRIERAALSGDDRRVLVSLPAGAWPNGLTLDTNTRRVHTRVCAASIRPFLQKVVVFGT